MPSPAPHHVRDRRQKRSKALRKLGFASYGEYLRSPHWLGLKQHYRASDLPQECICGESDVHLHHMTYERIGAEMLADLTPLCGRCHSLVHVLEFRGEIALDLEGLCDAAKAVEARALLLELAQERQRERDQRLLDQQAEIRALPFASRLMRAVDHAKRRHVDVGREVRLLRKMVPRTDDQDRLGRYLARVESKAYGWDQWTF